MESFDIAVFFAVFYEMLGPLLWVIIAGSIATTIAFFALLVRDRGLVSRRFVGSELLGIAGGFAAVAFMWLITHSSLADVGGPVDWILVLAIWLIGAVGTTLLVYVAWGIVAGRSEAHDAALRARTT